STHPWYYEVSKCAPQYALRYLSDAFKSFFKKSKGFPKFKKKGKHDSFTLDGAIKIDYRKIKVPVIGWLKTYEILPTGYKPKSVTISKQADKWFISWKIEIEVFKCDNCGFEIDRDLNAAINLKQEAVRLIVLACGLDSADTTRSSVSVV
ncbi:MAG: zinc ribbon domain-containing protein, partial [Sphaerospermopsis kisseleviana]